MYEFSSTAGAPATKALDAITSVVILAANGDRRAFAVRNATSVVMYLEFGAAATTSSVIAVPAGGIYADSTRCGDSVNAILASSTGNVFVQEFT
jgi:hypothetical protein